METGYYAQAIKLGNVVSIRIQGISTVTHFPGKVVGKVDNSIIPNEYTYAIATGIITSNANGVIGSSSYKINENTGEITIGDFNSFTDYKSKSFFLYSEQLSYICKF